MIGMIAAVIGTCSFVPPSYSNCKNKRYIFDFTWKYMMFVAGIALWLIHGIRIQDMALILANGVTFILASTILTYKSEI